MESARNAADRSGRERQVRGMTRHDEFAPAGLDSCACEQGRFLWNPRGSSSQPRPFGALGRLAGPGAGANF